LREFTSGEAYTLTDEKINQYKDGIDSSIPSVSIIGIAFIHGNHTIASQ
jgi:hypothetical protein